MRVKSANVISEVQKVRFFVMDMIYHNPDRSVMIPSSNELAAHFGIARYTVRLALEKMTEEGYLFTKRGTGTFTVPQSVSNGTDKFPLIGIRLGTGDQFYYATSMLEELGLVFQAVARRNSNIRLLTDHGDSPDDFDRVLDNAYIDSLIGISVFSEFTKVAAKRMPVVAVGCEAEGATNILYGGDKVVKKLLQLPRKAEKLSILSISDVLDQDLLFKALRDCPDIDFICEPVSFRKKEGAACFKDAISRIMPDIVALRTSSLGSVKKILEEMDISPNCCRLLNLEASNPRQSDFDMKLTVDLNYVMNLAVDEVMGRMSGKDNEKPSRFVIDYDLVLNDNMKTKKSVTKKAELAEVE